MIKESIKMSWSNIVHNKMRSFLTVLGIVIGVASIIALITLMQGATNQVTSQINKLGANKITIGVMGTPLKRGLNESDLQKIAKVEHVSGVSPSITGKVSIAAGKKSMADIDVQGKNEVFFNQDSDLIKSGRAINKVDVDYNTYVAVIGSDIARDLFFGENPIGKSLTVNGSTFVVIGILEQSGEFSFTSYNNSVIIPYTTAKKVLGSHNITNLDVFMSDSSRSNEIIDNINLVLNEAFNYKKDAFFLFNMEDMLDAIGDITGMMTLLLAGIASISLVVGGIGIMNMMLVSVTERTAEIGLRKALGAEPSRIQMQFIIEAIFLSLFGGLIGFLVGTAAAFVISHLAGINFALSVSTILLAVGFSAGVGIIFGYMPARKASQLNPIDALRSL